MKGERKVENLKKILELRRIGRMRNKGIKKLFSARKEMSEVFCEQALRY